jgi:hypothetical protein
MVQEAVYAKEEKRSSTNGPIEILRFWFFNEELMDEMSETGFCEIWIADDSTVEPYVQLIGQACAMARPTST